MAGYIGSKSSVTLVDGYSEAEADAEFVTKAGDTMTGDLNLGANSLSLGANNANSPQILFENSDSVTGDAALSTYDDSSGTMLVMGSNFYINSSGSETRFNTSEESSAVMLNRNGDLNLLTGGTGATATTRLKIDSSGNVGIGENDPDSTLTVKGASHTNFQVKSNSESTKAFIQTVQDSDVRIGSSTNHPVTFYQNGSERMRIDSSGRVSIGTTSTTRNLAVSSSGQTDLAIIAASGSSAQLCFGDGDDDNVGQIEYSHPTDSMRFYTQGAEKMRISSDGTKEFGTHQNENGGYNIRAGGYYAGSFAARFDGHGTGASNVVQIVNGYGEVGSIKIASNGTTTNFNTGSDYRLKTDVQPVTNASARIQSLNPVNFEWIRSGTRTDGFLAHEAQAVVPDCVSGAHNEVKVWEDNEDLPDGVSVGDNKTDDDGNTIPVYQSIDQSKLVPLLTAALQEALTEISDLKARVTALEA